MDGSRGGLSPWRLTPAVKALLIANAAVYVVELVVTNWLGSGFFVEHLAVTPSSVFAFPPAIWQVATYMWLHDPTDPMHLLFNLLVLWMFGGLLEGRWGARSFTRFYMLCGIGAGIVIALVGMLWSGQENVTTMGASGALFGMTVAFGVLYPDLQVYLMFMIPIRGRTLVLLLIGIQLLMLLARVPGVSIVGHLSGAAVGYLLVTGYWRPSQLLRRFGAASPVARKPRKRKKVDHLKIVPHDEREDEKGSNGRRKYLH